MSVQAFDVNQDGYVDKEELALIMKQAYDKKLDDDEA